MTECFELVYHGNGGFTWFEVWNMPVPHRKFNLRKINDYLKRIEDIRQEKQNVVTENTDMSKFKIPDHVKQLSKDNTDFVSKVKPKKYG